jgi:hypothetical protein
MSFTFTTSRVVTKFCKMTFLRQFAKLSRNFVFVKSFAKFRGTKFRNHPNCIYIRPLK